MNIFYHIIMVFTYIIVAVFAGILLFKFFPEYSLGGAIGVGIGSFLLLLQCHAIYFWSFGRAEMERRLMALHQDHQANLDQLEQNQQDIQKIQKIAQNADLSKNTAVIAEMKVLQTLLNQVVLKSRKSISNKGMDTKEIATTIAPKAKSELRGIKESFAPKFTKSEEIIRSDKEILNIMHHALEDNRVDLYLQSIVTLPARKTVYYEAYSRVRDDGDNVIFPSQYLKLAEDSGLVGTLDNLLLFRCIQIIRRLGPRRPGVRFFCNISSVSLNDKEFFPQFIEFMTDNKDLADRLVFEFSQQDVNSHSSHIWKSLKHLGGFGFRFSMDNIVDMNFDLAHLAGHYFRYLKIDAKYFLNGKLEIHPEDLKESFKRYEIDLIVEKIETDQMVVEILDYKIDYGQGFLFGEPQISSQIGVGL